MSDPLSFDPIQEAGRQWRRHWRGVTLAAITDDGRELAERATPVLNRGRFGLETLDPEQLRELNALLREVRADADDFSPE